MDCQEELKIMKQMNRDLMDEVEMLRKQINDLEQLVIGPTEWYTGDEFRTEGDDD